MDLILDTQPANNIGSIGVNRVIVPVSGGTFDGPKLKGTVLPGGDWIVRRPDGSSVLDVRIILQTDDAQKIYMQYRGIKYTPKDGPQVLANRSGVRDRRREIHLAEQHHRRRRAPHARRQGRLPHFPDSLEEGLHYTTCDRIDQRLRAASCSSARAALRMFISP